MPKAMIVTVGTGETVSHGICCAIKQQNPDHIIFVLTKESKEKTLPLILQDKIMQDKEDDEHILVDENDVEAIRFECQGIVNKLIGKHFDPKDITVDYTSGTKAMSVGVVLGALDKKIGSLVYVSGKRETNGRVISGTEKVISLEPNRSYAESFFTEAVNLFNCCQFDGCLEVITQTKHLIADTKFLEKINLLEKLTSAYSFWDKFELNKAFDILEGISKNELAANWGIKRKLDSNKEVLYKEKKEKFCLERIVDLLENARRRGELEKKYDDAVARLYRCLEYIAQFRIVEKGLYKNDEKGNPDTENLDISKIPQEFQGKYLRCKDQRDGKIKLGLKQDYELLNDFSDEIGRHFKDNEKEFVKSVSARNKSILAHGFGPISGDTYKQMMAKVKELLKIFVPEIDNFVEKIKFTQIKL